nr:hypothetical protein GCM10020063_090740 [Dactylosporangium thailandense]
MPTAILRLLHDELGAADGQRVRWNAAAWQSGLAGTALASPVDAVASGLPHGNGYVSISRADVFAFAQRPYESFVAAMAWGFGPSGYGWYRTRSILEAAEPDRIPQLITALRAVADSAVQTWASLEGTAGLRGLGPAFGTKVAYFAGYDRVHRCGPLITDRWTAWAHWALTGETDRYSITGGTAAGDG